MSTITKESIAETIEGLEQLVNRGIQSVHIEMAVVGMRRLQSSLEAEAVPDERAAFEEFMEGRFKDSIDRKRVKNGDQGYFAWDMIVAWIVWQGRAAMLQGADGNSPVIPDGWKLVPVEPTEAMRDIKHVGLDVYTGVATDDYYSIGGEQAAKVWKAMISKSPKLENRNGY